MEIRNRPKTATNNGHLLMNEEEQKNLIPKKYKIKHNASNLFRVELSHFWRMLYTLKGDEIEIIAFILDITDHPDYNKKFGYK